MARASGFIIRPAPGLTTGVFIVAAERDGPWHSLAILKTPPGPRNQLTLLNSFERANATDTDFTLTAVRLAPDGIRFAVEELEYAVDAVDSIVRFYTVKGQLLFFCTDNTACPEVRITGDMPDVPAQLQAAQQAADADWPLMQADDPDAPRPIVTAWLDDVSGDGTVTVAGWLPNGNMLLTGRTRMLLECVLWETYAGELDDWWAETGPHFKTREWSVLASGIGPLPASYVLAEQVPEGPLVTLLNGALYLDGIVQKGWPSMIAFAAPNPGS